MMPAVKSADRTVDIVERVARAVAPVTAQQLADGLGIPASSLSYLLGTLVTRGWLAGAQPRGYVVGPVLRGLLDRGGNMLADFAAPVVRRVRQQLNETCGYFERRGDDLVAVFSETGLHPLSYTMVTGLRGPLHAFAAGKAILATTTEEDCDRYLAREVALERFTPATITAPDALRRALRAVRERGYAVSEQEHTLGLTSIAVALPEQGGAAISVAIPSARFDEAMRVRALDALRQARAQLGGADARGAA